MADKSPNPLRWSRRLDEDALRERLLAMTVDQRHRFKRFLVIDYILVLIGIILIVSNVLLTFTGLDPSISLVLGFVGFGAVVIGSLRIAFALRVNPMYFLRGHGTKPEGVKWYKDWRMWAGAAIFGIIATVANNAFLAVVSPIIGIVPWPSSWRVEILFPLITIGFWILVWRTYYWIMDKRRKRNG
jgi:uncharacterized integral membrane protein